jgi:NAD-dependent SIR2 family protein deacetylase
MASDARRKDNKQRCWGYGARRRKHGKIIESSATCNQCSWETKSRILPKQRQDALKECLCRCTRHVYGISLIAPQASVMPNELVLMRKQVVWHVGTKEAMRN